MASKSPVLEVPEHVLNYLRRAADADARDRLPGRRSARDDADLVNDGPTIWIWTRPDTSTARHMEQNPLVSFAIDEYTPNCAGPRASRAPATPRSSSTRVR